MSNLGAFKTPGLFLSLMQTFYQYVIHTRWLDIHAQGCPKLGLEKSLLSNFEILSDRSPPFQWNKDQSISGIYAKKLPIAPHETVRFYTTMLGSALPNQMVAL